MAIQIRELTIKAEISRQPSQMEEKPMSVTEDSVKRIIVKQMERGQMMSASSDNGSRRER